MTLRRVDAYALDQRTVSATATLKR